MPARDLDMVARFGEDARPAVGSIHLVRGLAEGFPRMYAFVEGLRCVKEISQLCLEDIVHEFPGCRLSRRDDRASIRSGDASDPVAEARRVALESETVPLSPAPGPGAR